MMSNNTADLFNVRSHNPSFFSVKESTTYEGPLLDFCIPVNLHFPPPEMVRRISENLPEILRYYPDYAEVHAKHIGEIGKSLGWHGVRLGYAATNPRVADLLRSQLPFWNVNGLAAYILKTVSDFKDEFLQSFALVEQDKRYMLNQLEHIPGLRVFPSRANFLYVELPANVPGRKLRDRLLKQYGLMVRECSNKIGSSERYLRLAVQTRDAVDLLTQALSRELS